MFSLFKILFICLLVIIYQNAATAQSTTPGYPIKNAIMAEDIRNAIVAANDLGDCISSTPKWVHKYWKGAIFKDTNGNLFRHMKTVMQLTSLDKTRCSLIYFWTKQILNTSLKKWEYYSVNEKIRKTIKIKCAKKK